MRAEIALTLREDLTNSWSVAHGGVTMTLLDVVMAHAAQQPQPERPCRIAGRGDHRDEDQLPARRLGRLTAHGKLLHRTASMAFTEGSVFDEKGELVAHATGTFKYMKGLPAGGRASRG